jgi:hypothetical protein
MITRQVALSICLATLCCGFAAAAPTIGNLHVARVAADSAVVRWTTDVPADSRVEYGTGPDYGSTTVLDSMLLRVHYHEVRGLAPDTTYHFRVISRDAHGLVSQSAAATFRTLPTQEVIELGSSITTPYILSKRGAIYRLTGDIVAPRTAFGVAARDVTLDLNGHTVTYADGVAVAIPNGGFEEPLSVGWDTTNAPHAARHEGTWHSPATKYSGVASLAWAVPAPTEQHIVSRDAIMLPGKYTYELSAMAFDFVSGWAADHKKIRKSVQLIDADTGQPLNIYAEHVKGSGLGQYYFNKVFRLERDTRVRIKVGIGGDVSTVSEGRIYIDDVSIQLANYHGVVTLSHYRASAYPDLPVSSASKAGLKIMNGTLQQSTRGKGFNCEAFKGSEAEIDRVTAIVTGTDSNNVDGSWGGGLYIHDSIFHNVSDRISSRHHHTGANVTIQRSRGMNLIRGNTMTGSPQYAVTLTAMDNATAYAVEIAGNALSNNATATQAYNIGVTGSNIAIHHNTIRTQNGNGILAGGENAEVFANTIEVLLKPNQEYGWNVSGKAIELRNARHASVHDNVVSTFTDAEHLPVHAMVLRGSRNGIRIFDNTFRAITADDKQRVAAFRYYHDGSEDAQIERNVLESNSTIVMCEEGFSRGAIFKGNILRRASQPHMEHFKTFYFGWLDKSVAAHRFVAGNFYDTDLQGGASFNDAYVDQTAYGKSYYSVGWSLDILVRDAAGNPVSDALVSVTNTSGSEVYSGQTRADGMLAGKAYLEQYRNDFPTSSTPATTVFTPHRVTVSKDGYEQEHQEIRLLRATVLNFTLTPEPARTTQSSPSAP